MEECFVSPAQMRSAIPVTRGLLQANTSPSTQKWSHQRQVFGKPLIAQPVIRQKFAHMYALVESGQAWLEQITYQMTRVCTKFWNDLQDDVTDTETRNR